MAWRDTDRGEQEAVPDSPRFRAWLPCPVRYRRILLKVRRLLPPQRRRRPCLERSLHRHRLARRSRFLFRFCFRCRLFFGWHPTESERERSEVGLSCSKAGLKDIGLNGDGAGGDEALRAGEAEGCQE